jgi:hypothetical protein
MVRNPIAHAATVSFPVLLLAVTLTAQTGDQTSPTTAAPGASKVRIVRLSEVKGGVQIDRNNGRGLEKAITNLPIVEKNRVETGNGVAEIEFEDNSTLRVAPDSVVVFPTLERMPGGTTVSSVQLVKGMAYVSLMKTAGNEFNLLFGDQNLRLPSGSHVRLDLGDTQAKLAVLDADVHIESPSGVMDVPRKRTVTFALADSSQPVVAKEVASNSFDEWDHKAVDYHARSAAMSAFGNSPYSYGMNEMAYYGSFANVGGCGSMWRPYFASAAWDPYSNGSWAYYEGAGYSWVSPYQWGWTPYHSGSWSYCQGSGWGWMPGGTWMGLNNTGLFANLKGPIHAPIAPGHLPVKGEPTLLAVGMKPAVHNEISPAGSFVFRKDSAGLGIPREGLGKLDKFSEHALQHGVASTPVYVEAPGSSGARGRGGNETAGVATIHRGSPPPGSGGGFSAGGNSNAGSRTSSTTSASSPSSSHSSSGGGSHH